MPPIALPPCCNTAAAEALLPELVAAFAQGPIEIDGSGVSRVGQAVLQLLASARRSGERTTIIPSPALRDAARLAGLEHELFDEVAA